MTKRHHEDHLQALNDIRSMMQRSTRFMSLSGLSGISAGICALIGAGVAFYYLGKVPFAGEQLYYERLAGSPRWGINWIEFSVWAGSIVLIAALSFAIFFTTRQARKKGQQIWDQTTWRMLVNLSIPLVIGAIFCLVFYLRGDIGLVAPATLVFYGLGLVNASKYSLRDLKFLGLLECGLGCIGLFYVGYGLELWAIGFGVLHIAYGTYMWWKYEREGR
jgi:hypothetical protein